MQEGLLNKYRELNEMKRLFLSAALVCTLSGVASVVEWEFPRMGSCHEGIAFADGVTGVLVWGGGDTVNLTVGRADLWDHRGGYDWLPSQSYTNIVSLVRAGKKDELLGLFTNECPPGWGGTYNPYMLPLGRVVARVPGRKILKGSLDTSTGLGKLEFSGGVEATLAMSRNSRAFAMEFSQEVELEVEEIPATEQPVWDVLERRGFEKARRFRSDSGAGGGFVWRLPADRPVWLGWRRMERGLAVRTGRGESVGEMQCRFSDLSRESVEQWRAFWNEGARVSVPDAAIQEMFDYGMYRFGAMTDPDGVAAGLQGPWLEDDALVPWNGDYHFNINVQECYSPAYRGGHFANLMPLFEMVLSWRPKMRENASRFVHIPDGYVLPHSVDDRGVCIGGFWAGTIDHGSTAWVASMMFKYVKYSGDVAFLRRGAYDFMVGAMNVYLAMMEERDGRLSIPLAPSPEWGAADVRMAVGRDSSFQLAAAHRLAENLLSAASLLGERADPRWLDVRRRLPAYAAGEGGIQLFEGQPFIESHRHHSHMAGMYPFDTIASGDGTVNAVVLGTYRTWIKRGTGAWTGWCVPWASILHTHMGSSDAAVAALHDWRTFFNNPGHGSLHDAWRPGFTLADRNPRIMQMDGQCAAATAVMEMMAHEIGGKVEFFKGCPDSWKDVSFRNLALFDGRRVSGRRINGVVDIEIEPSR